MEDMAYGSTGISIEIRANSFPAIIVDGLSSPLILSTF